MDKSVQIFWHHTFPEHKQFAGSTSLLRTLQKKIDCKVGDELGNIDL